MTTQALATIPFHGQTLLATLVNDIPHVAMKPICENIGLDWASQFSRIKRNPVLSQGIVIMTIPSKIGNDGKSYMTEMFMLPVKYLNGWLFGIDSNRVKPEIKDRVIEYQTECFEVLANHFMPNYQEPTKITKTQQGEISARVSNMTGISATLKKTVWSRFNNHFKLSSYKDLPFKRYDEAIVYLERLTGIYDKQVVMIAIPKQEYEELKQARRVEGELLAQQAMSRLNTITIAINDALDYQRYLVTRCGDVTTLFTVPDDYITGYRKDVVNQLRNEAIENLRANGLIIGTKDQVISILESLGYVVKHKEVLRWMNIDQLIQLIA